MWRNRKGILDKNQSRISVFYGQAKEMARRFKRRVDACLLLERVFSQLNSGSDYKSGQRSCCGESQSEWSAPEDNRMLTIKSLWLPLALSLSLSDRVY